PGPLDVDDAVGALDHDVRGRSALGRDAGLAAALLLATTTALPLRWTAGPRARLIARGLAVLAGSLAFVAVARVSVSFFGVGGVGVVFRGGRGRVHVLARRDRGSGHVGGGGGVVGRERVIRRRVRRLVGLRIG